MVGAGLEWLGHGRRGQALPQVKERLVALSLLPALGQPEVRTAEPEDSDDQRRYGRAESHRDPLTRHAPGRRLRRHVQFRPLPDDPSQTLQVAPRSFKSETADVAKVGYQVSQK